jgi:hypothetical protein
MWLETGTTAIQALAAVVQAAFAILIWIVTRRYVNLTRDLVSASENQLQVQRQQFRAALYERRLMVFRATMGFLADFLGNLQIEMPKLVAFRRDTLEAEYLFSEEIGTYLDQIAKKASEHYVLSKRRNDPRDVNRITELLSQIHSLEVWFAEDAFKEGKELFGRYLRLSEQDIEQLFSRQAAATTSGGQVRPRDGDC